MGTTNIGKDAPIYVACDVNGSRVTLDTLKRSGNFGVNTTIDLVLTGKVKVSDGGISNLAFYTIYGGDMKDWDDTLEMEFNALPGPVIDFGDVNGELNTELPHILDAGAGHKAYLWQDNSTGQTYTVMENGIYSVTVTGQNDCQTSKTVRINMSSGLGDMDEHVGEIKIYPNPNNGEFIISVEGLDQHEFKMRIFNNLGQLVHSQEIDAAGSGNSLIGVQDLPRGIYHIVIYTGGKSYRSKMIIQ